MTNQLVGQQYLPIGQQYLPPPNTAPSGQIVYVHGARQPMSPPATDLRVVSEIHALRVDFREAMRELVGLMRDVRHELRQQRREVAVPNNREAVAGNGGNGEGGRRRRRRRGNGGGQQQQAAPAAADGANDRAERAQQQPVEVPPLAPAPIVLARAAAAEIAARIEKEQAEGNKENIDPANK